MVLCSVEYVKSQNYANTVTELEIARIIKETSTEVLALCGTTDETNPLVILAGKYSVRANILRWMKNKGELASAGVGNSTRKDTPDHDIDYYQSKADALIEKYTSIKSCAYSSPTFNTGFNNHHHGGRYGHD